MARPVCMSLLCAFHKFRSMEREKKESLTFFVRRYVSDLGGPRSHPCLNQQTQNFEGKFFLRGKTSKPAQRRRGSNELPFRVAGTRDADLSQPPFNYNSTSIEWVTRRVAHAQVVPSRPSLLRGTLLPLCISHIWHIIILAEISHCNSNSDSHCKNSIIACC